MRISYDYDGVLSTSRGKKNAIDKIEKGDTVYIISARSNNEELLRIARKLGIPNNRVYAMGSNNKKIDKIKELNINIHYDDNQDVINKLPNIGRKY